MHCTLLIPDLLLSSDLGDTPYHDLHLPALARLLARGRCTTLAALGMERWLCEAFEVERQHDWPIAPLTLAFDGGETAGAYWLRCDPVHLRPHRNQVRLLADATCEPTLDEARALVASLNAHFAQDALAFHAPHPARWYLRLDRTPALNTQPLPEVAGKDINRHLPTGSEMLHWHHLLNEIQMLLHAHPVNQEREARGQPPINSIWPWGGGVKPVVRGSHYTLLWSNDALALALAAASNMPSRPVPDSAEPLIDPAAGNTDKQLVVLPQLRVAARCGDVDQWRATLHALERDWFAPLRAALSARQLSGLALVALNDKQCLRYEVTGIDLWKFWRRIKPLTDHA